VETVRLDEGLFRSTAPNGLVVLSEQLPWLRSTAIGVWVGTASAHEARDKMGLSHLLEHMVFKGTERRSARQIALELEVRGGSLDAYTGRDNTSFQAHVLDADLPLAVDILTDLVRRPLLRPQDLDAERRVVIEEISGVEDTPDDLVFDLHAGTLWSPHPYGYSILGSRESVSALQVSDLRALHEGAYFTGNCVIAAAGNLEHEVLLAGLEREGWFAGRESRAALDPVTPAPARRGVERREGRDTSQCHIAPLCAGDPRQRVRRRDVEPAVPAGPGGAGTGLRRLCLSPALPVGRPAGRLRGHPAGVGGCGVRCHSCRVRSRGHRLALAG
jgi:predicted Zn-dependent peptidase